MKEENFNYLSNEIKFGGFDEKMIPALRPMMMKGENNFMLRQDSVVGTNLVQAYLNFNQSQKTGYYFFNDYRMMIFRQGDQLHWVTQHFFRKPDRLFTFKQSYNLTQGRAVALIQIDDRQVAQEQWAKLNYKEIDTYGNTLIKVYPVSYQYEIEKALGKYPVRELRDQDDKTVLLHGIRKGNLTLLSLEKPDGSIIKALATANPQARTVDFYDPKTQQKIPDIIEYLKPSEKLTEQSGPKKNTDGRRRIS